VKQVLNHSIQTPDDLKEYVPVLPSVRANFFELDPQLGCAVTDVGGGVFVVSDNMWQSAFLVTDDGVVVFDAPESFGKSIQSVIAKITNKPIKTLIYSHIHRDHIGGSSAFRDIRALEIVSCSSVAEFLREQKDSNRLLPTATFESQDKITLGGKTIELSRHFYHSNEGDLFIYVPDARFMMAIDCITPGYAPFSGFDLTTSFDQYLKLFDQLAAYEFTTFVGGHLTQTGTKEDVGIAKEFALDVYRTVKRIHNSMDQNAIVAEAAKTIGYDNKFLLFKVILDRVTDQAVAELQPRWINRLAGVDVWLRDNVSTALIYVRWDDKVS
jgi:glyoxylase-like metal-dependent hydrolase (beta-lactamase superfamily II)